MSVNATIEEISTTMSEQQSIVQEVQSPTIEETMTTDDITSRNVVEESPKEIPITDVVIDNDVTGLNLLIAFGQIAHKRGAFNIEETAKLHDAIQYFAKKMNAPPPTPIES